MEQVLEKAKASHQLPRWVVVIFALLLLIAFVYLLQYKGESVYPESLQDVVYQTPVQLQEFSLQDHNRQPFGLGHFANHWTFLVFGYTYCPDVCPAALSQMVNLKDRLSNSGLSQNTQFVFVSVDPARDKPEILAEYIQYFDESFTAVTGVISDIEQFEDQLDSFHRYEKEDSAGSYAVTHSTEVFLVDPSASVVAKFQPPLMVEKVVGQVTELMNLSFQTNGKT
jgi:protein SCO1